MAGRQHPSSTTFVLRGKNRKQFAERATRLPSFEEAEPFAEDERLLLLRLAEGAVDSKTAWEHVQTAVGEEVLVAPVLIDDHGHDLYPTGTVQVRFHEPPSRRELRQFAQVHRLLVLRRNRRQPAQVSFSIRDPSHTYLPDLVASLNDAPEVRAAWPETMSRYKRY